MRTIWKRGGVAAACLAAMTGLVLAAGTVGGDRAPDGPALYTVANLRADLTLPCRVTGCDPEPLAAIYGAGLAAMDAGELGEARELSLAIAEASARAAKDASMGPAEIHARLAAQAAGDAAVARLYAGEEARRAETPSG